MQNEKQQNGGMVEKRTKHDFIDQICDENGGRNNEVERRSRTERRERERRSKRGRRREERKKEEGGWMKGLDRCWQVILEDKVVNQEPAN